MVNLWFLILHNQNIKKLWTGKAETNGNRNGTLLLLLDAGLLLLLLFFFTLQVVATKKDAFALVQSADILFAIRHLSGLARTRQRNVQQREERNTTTVRRQQRPHLAHEISCHRLDQAANV